jgi:hypothetical protein
LIAFAPIVFGTLDFRPDPFIALNAAGARRKRGASTYTRAIDLSRMRVELDQLVNELIQWKKT